MARAALPVGDLFAHPQVMTGNSFLQRVKHSFQDSEKQPSNSPFRVLERSQVIKYTGIQALCLGLLWGLKSFKPTAMFFPSVIAMLIVIRQKFLERVFSEKELRVLDKEIG